MDLQQALNVNVDDITTEQQASEAYQALFYPADMGGYLDDADPRFDTAGNDELPNVLAESAFNADQSGNSTGSEVFNLMRKLVVKFPNADFSA